MPVPRTHLRPSLDPLYDHLDAQEAAIADPGTLAMLEAGTDETPRLFSAKDIADYVAAEIAAIP